MKGFRPSLAWNQEAQVLERGFLWLKSSYSAHLWAKLSNETETLVKSLHKAGIMTAFPENPELCTGQPIELLELK